METRNLANDDYLKTAQKVFEGCGMDGEGGLPVSKLMEKFSCYVPSDRSQDLQCLLDPDQCNPIINVHELAGSLEKYGAQHSGTDFDESINLRSGGTPIDSDSGISSDMGWQVVEELQAEVRARRRTEQRLRLRLEAGERATEDAVAALTSERDALRCQLVTLREEKSALLEARAEAEEGAARLAAAEEALADRGAELDRLRRRLRAATDAADALGAEKQTLQALLAESKAECHRINDMYAARQAALLEESELYRSSHADLSTRFQEQEEFLQQTLKEKVLLEMEMADVLNRSRPDRSPDVSCADPLAELDSLRLHHDTEDLSLNELYMSDYKIERGRPSLFDELLRVDSFQRHLPGDKSEDKQDDQNYSDTENGNDIETTNDREETNDKDIKSNQNMNDHRKIDKNIGMHNISLTPKDHNTSTEDISKSINKLKIEANNGINVRKNASVETENDDIKIQNIFNSMKKLKEKVNNDHNDSMHNISTQTQYNNTNAEHVFNSIDKLNEEVNYYVDVSTQNISFQTEENTENIINDTNKLDIDKCETCNNNGLRMKELELNLERSERTISQMHGELSHYEQNLTVLQSNFDCVEEKNRRNQSVIEMLRKKIECLEGTLKCRSKSIDGTTSCRVETQTSEMTASVGTQANESCVECEVRSQLAVPTTVSRVRDFLWDSLKGILQLLAVLCLCGALLFLYNVSHYNYASRRCVRNGALVPWQWLGLSDLLDLLFRIEYTGEIPM